jgi:hypothetical protein
MWLLTAVCRLCNACGLHYAKALKKEKELRNKNLKTNFMSGLDAQAGQVQIQLCRNLTEGTDLLVQQQYQQAPKPETGEKENADVEALVAGRDQQEDVGEDYGSEAGPRQQQYS